MGQVRSGDRSGKTARGTSAQRRAAHHRGHHLAARQWCQMALDPRRTWRLAPRLLAVPPLDARRRLGQNYGARGCGGRAKTGFCLHRWHGCAGASEGCRSAAEQTDDMSLRFNRKTDGDTQALGRSRGGFGSKIVGVCDAAGRLVDFVLVPGQAHELAPSLELLKRLPKAPAWTLADMACDAKEFRAAGRAIGTTPVVPSRKGTKQPEFCPVWIYRHRNLIECCCARLNERRVIPPPH